MANPWRIPDVWMDAWSVVLCNHRGMLEQHNFLLSRRAGFSLGADRAEHDAKEFAKEFKDSVRIMYCGRSQEMPEDLRQDVVQNHHCDADGE